jgi:hypothetical protein
MKHAKRKIGWKVVWIVSGSVVGALALAYIGAAIFFYSHFGFDTSIEGANCSFKTVAEVEQIISDKVDDYSLSIEGRDSLKKTLKAYDVGLSYVPDGQVQTILDSQHPLLWISRVFKPQADVLTLPSVKLDSTKFKNAVNRLDLFNVEKMRLPVDAHAKFEGSQYVVEPEDMGSTLREPETRAVIEDALLELAPTVDLHEAACYTSPDIFANNPDLVEQVALYNQYTPFSITYTFDEKTEVLDALTAINWVAYDENGAGYIDEEAILNWVREFGIRHDTMGTTREFIAATGEPAIVEGGLWGWEVDEEAEFEAIKAALENHTGETREPIYVQRGVVYAEPGQPDWGTTYIELNLTTQHMYYIVEGKIEFEADVVTGSPYPSRETPQGAWCILEMSSPAILRGEIQSNGKPEYETQVSYWMRMTWAGHGFHDATWQPFFGGDRYTYAGSHGCINMSYYDAETLYGLIYEGLPVVSHY